MLIGKYKLLRMVSSMIADHRVKVFEKTSKEGSLIPDHRVYKAILENLDRSYYTKMQEDILSIYEFFEKNQGEDSFFFEAIRGIRVNLFNISRAGSIISSWEAIFGFEMTLEEMGLTLNKIVLNNDTGGTENG